MENSRGRGIGHRLTEPDIITHDEKGPTFTTSRAYRKSSLTTTRPNSARVIAWPAGAHFSRNRSKYEVILVRGDADEPFAQSCLEQPLELRMVVERPLLVVLLRLGNLIPWCHIPYAWPLSYDAKQTRNLVQAPWRDGEFARLG